MPKAPTMLPKSIQNGAKMVPNRSLGPSGGHLVENTFRRRLQDTRRTPQTLPKSSQNPSKIISKKNPNFKTFFEWIFEPVSTQNASFVISFWMHLDMKIAEIMKTWIFENLHSRCSESIELLIFFMKCSWNFVSKSLPKRVVSLYHVFHWFYLRNDPEMTPKLLQNQFKIYKKLYKIILNFS